MVIIFCKTNIEENWSFVITSKVMISGTVAEYSPQESTVALDLTQVLFTDLGSEEYGSLVRD